MTNTEAEKLIEDFHKCIKDLRPTAIVHSNKQLPYTASRIKYAHFVYGEYFVKQGFYDMSKNKGSREEIFDAFSKKITELTESYGLIDSLFIEDPEAINIKYREYLEGLENGIVTDFLMPNPFGETRPIFEFRNFLGEYWFYEFRDDLFNKSPAGAFMYDGVRNKATQEKDIKTLIQLVNTTYTRTVNYPGKKSNEESIFI